MAGSRSGTSTAEISARFDGPARAVRCALALRDARRRSALPLRGGVHVGEIEIARARGRWAGARMHRAHLAARAAAGEVLVSGVVVDLVAGSGLHFAERATRIDRQASKPLALVCGDVRAAPGAGQRAATATASDLDAAQRARARSARVSSPTALSNAAIAQRLRLSEHTVKRHVANILLKLDLPTRAAAAAVAGRRRRLGHVHGALARTGHRSHGPSGEAAAWPLCANMPDHRRGDSPRRRMPCASRTGLLVTLITAAASARSLLGYNWQVPRTPRRQAAYRDIEQTLGSVPTFFKLFPEVGIAGAWAEFKSVQLNPKTKLDGKTKELIGLAVCGADPVSVLHLFPHRCRQAQRRDRRGDPRGRGHGGDLAPLEHGAQRHADRSRRFQARHRHRAAGGGGEKDRRQVAVTARRDRAMHAECIDIAALKRAIETRDARRMAAFYTDDALVRIIDCNNPPSKPRELRGQGAIVAYYDDVCSRAMTHRSSRAWPTASAWRSRRPAPIPTARACFARR